MIKEEQYDEEASEGENAYGNEYGLKETKVPNEALTSLQTEQKSASVERSRLACSRAFQTKSDWKQVNEYSNAHSLPRN